jgi:hypothetical protein
LNDSVSSSNNAKATHMAGRTAGLGTC